MIINRTKNTVRNVIWGVVNKIINLLLPFVVRTVMIYVMGVEYLGLGSLFSSILTVLNLAELGVSSAIVFSLYEPIAKDDKETICALMNLYKKAYRVIGTIVFLGGIIVLPFLKYLIKGDVPPDINIYILYGVYLFNTVISYFLFAYKNCLFSAHQRNDVGLKVGNILSILHHVISILALIIFKNYYIYVIFFPLFSIISNVTIAIWASKEYPDYKCRGRVSDEIKNKIKKQIMGLMIGRISGTIRASIDSLFVSILLGLTDVAKYNNYFYIVTAVAGFIQLIEGSMVAGVGNSLVTETVDKNYRDFKKFTFMLQWIVGIGAICIFCLTQPFMRLWVGDQLIYNNFMPALCAFYFLVCNVNIIRSIYTQASGMWWELRILSCIDIFANILLNSVLGYFLGAYGILLASCIDVLLVSMPWTTYVLFKGYFGMKYYKEYLFQLIKYISVASVIGLGIWIICEKLPIENLMINLGIRGIVCFTLGNVVYWALYRKNQLFAQSKDFVISKFKKNHA